MKELNLRHRLHDFSFPLNDLKCIKKKQANK